MSKTQRFQRPLVALSIMLLLTPLGGCGAQEQGVTLVTTAYLDRALGCLEQAGPPSAEAQQTYHQLLGERLRHASEEQLLQCQAAVRAAPCALLEQELPAACVITKD